MIVPKSIVWKDYAQKFVIIYFCSSELFIFKEGSLYLVVDDPIETAETINGDLDKIHIWSEKWLVKFNPQKTETMILSKKNNKPNPALIDNQSEFEPFITALWDLPHK
jgi:hypothetical protein